MSYLIKEKMMRDKSNQDDSVTLGDSAVEVVENVSTKQGGTEAPLSGAKKERVEVAGYQNLPAVVANETLNIDKLPNEMLEKIFENLMELENGNGSNRKSKLATNNQSYLNCRLVSTRWKFWMESVLEKKSFSIWRAVPISIENLEAEPPALCRLFVLETKNRFTPVKWAFLPPPLESWDGKGSPFPSHSLKLIPHLEDCDHLPSSSKPRRRAQLIRLTDFFSKFGEHITTLILTSVTLSPETFIGILENTPKLKALNLRTVVFRGDLVNFAHLPALQHLLYLRAFGLRIMLKKGKAHTPYSYDGGKGIKQLYSWILSPLQQQLLTLEIDGRSSIDTIANFASLERLHMSCENIYHVNDPSFLQPNLFRYPRLKSLFLTDIDIRFKRDIMEWFQKHIAPFYETLVELCLAIPRDFWRSIPFKEAVPLFQLPPKSIHKKTNEVVFRKLKTLEITFPEFPEEVEVIKALIKMFPNLEALTFLDRTYADAKNVVDREEYKKVCPALKKIRIRDLYNEVPSQ